MSSDIEYVEQFLSDYRAGYIDFGKIESKEDKDLRDELLFALEKYDLSKQVQKDAQNKPPLTFETANQRVPRELSGRKHMGKIRELMIEDDRHRSGTYRSHDAFTFKMLIDKARAHGLILDSENVRRKFKICEEKRIESEKKLAKAYYKVAQLEGMVRLLGGDPNIPPNTLSGDVDEGGGSDEQR